MKKLDLTPYEFGEQKCDVKKMISVLLFAPQLNLSSRDLFIHDTLAKKVELAGDSVLLEDADYNILKNALIERITGYGRHHMPLLERIVHAPEVPVEEKKT